MILITLQQKLAKERLAALNTMTAERDALAEQIIRLEYRVTILKDLVAGLRKQVNEFHETLAPGQYEEHAYYLDIAKSLRDFAKPILQSAEIKKRLILIRAPNTENAIPTEAHAPQTNEDRQEVVTARSDRIAAKPWQQVKISNENILLADKLMDAFMTKNLAAGSPIDSVMFVGPTGKNFYFTPKAVEIAGPIIAAFGGKNCLAPGSSEVEDDDDS